MRAPSLYEKRYTAGTRRPAEVVYYTLHYYVHDDAQDRVAQRWCYLGRINVHDRQLVQAAIATAKGSQQPLPLVEHDQRRAATLMRLFNALKRAAGGSNRSDR